MPGKIKGRINRSNERMIRLTNPYPSIKSSLLGELVLPSPKGWKIARNPPTNMLIDITRMIFPWVEQVYGYGSDNFM